MKRTLGRSGITVSARGLEPTRLPGGLHTIAIPGFETVRQVEKNAEALQRGLLAEAQMREIETLLQTQGADSGVS